MRWELTDLAGRRLAFIAQRDPGSWVQADLNGHRMASCNISVEEQAAAEVYPLARRLRVFMPGYTKPLFYGPLTAPSFRGKEGKITLNALSPSHQLERLFVPFPGPIVGPGAEVPGQIESWAPQETGQTLTLLFTNIDQAEILARLVEVADQRPVGWPSHGIVRGSLPLSRVRTRGYEPGKQIYQAIFELSQVIGGPDFDFEPLYDLQGKTAQLNVYPDGMGTDRSKDVRFEFNTGRNNCDDATWSPDGLSAVTQATEVGQSEFGGEPPHYTSTQDDAGKIFGKWESFEGRPDVNESFTIEEHAQGVVSGYAFPPDIIDFTPNLAGNAEGLSVPPPAHPDAASLAPKDAYWLGDQVGVVMKKGYFRFSGKGRVTSIRLTEADSAGNIQEKATVASTIFEAGAS